MSTALRPPQQGGADREASSAAGVKVPQAYRVRQRRPWMMALSLALVAGCGVGAWMLYGSLGERTGVVTVAKKVEPGEAITAGDLATAEVAVDATVSSIPASERGSLVGKRAAVGLTPGSLLSREQLGSGATVREGEQVVPVGLKVGVVPASSLAPGQQVQVVQVPSEDGGDGAAAGGSVKKPDQEAESVSARVVKVGPRGGQGASGVVVVDVAVEATDGATVLGWSAREEAALALESGGAR